jgi:N4-gp56 family major capsid protein
MKSIEELSTLTTTSIADLVPKVILEEVEEAARARRFGRSLIRINDDLTRTKGRSIIIGRRGTITAAAVSEGTTLGGSGITYTSNTITPTKSGVSVHITQESIEGCELNLIKDAVTEAGIALADKEDNDLVVALLGYTAGSTIPTGAETIALGTRLVYADETPTNLTSVDYYAGNIIVGGACTIAYKTSSFAATYFDDCLADGFTWSTDAYKEIATAVTKVRGRKWNPKFLLVHPDALLGILKSDMFIDASKYGSAEPIVNGEVGKVAGLKVLVSTNMPNGAALVIDPTRAAWMAVRRNLDMKRWDNPSTDSIELYFYTEYAAAATDKDALQIIVNITAKSTT